MSLEFHPAVQRDIDEIIRHYDRVSVRLGDEFFEEFLSFADKAAERPKRFHPHSEDFRRANLKRFPFHFLHREIPGGIRVTVVRHHSRHPSYGAKRR